jgi:hypothetical protein
MSYDTRWEYLVFRIQNGKLQDKLNELGSQCWEAISCSLDNEGWADAMMKREKRMGYISGKEDEEHM